MLMGSYAMALSSACETDTHTMSYTDSEMISSSSDAEPAQYQAPPVPGTTPANDAELLAR